MGASRRVLNFAASSQPPAVIPVLGHTNRTITDSFYFSIDELFLNKSTPEKCYRLETYRSTGAVSANTPQQLRCYFVSRCSFPATSPASSRTDGQTDIRTVSDASFLEKASANTLEIYQRVMWAVERRYGPVIEVFEVEGSR